MQLAYVNPKSRKAKGKRVRRAAAPKARARKSIRRRYRSNPISGGGLMRQGTAAIKAGVMGAGGAVLVDALLSRLPLPSQMATGGGRIAAQVLAGVALAAVVSKMLKKPALGADIAAGAVTVAVYKTMRNSVAGPLGLSTVDGFDAGLLGIESDGLLGLGFYGPGPNYAAPQQVPVMSGFYEGAGH